MTEDETGDDICTACSGTGDSPGGYRTDGYGPHYVCQSCRGSGVRRDHD